jgi:5'-nucleotidase
MATKKMTILHANDIHGQLQFKVNKDFEVQGGISLMSGYINRVRKEQPATFFSISGDVLQEDIWGSDYKGTNTVSLINYIKPDAISLGNHELDYGLAHLLIFKECIKAPVLCCNMIVSNLNEDLFLPSMVCDVDGIRILLIGVIPKAFFNRIMSDEFCRDMLIYKDTYEAVREEINKHSDEHIDLTILMSHYGLDGDRALAEEMPDDLHVDMILGGHTHVNMEKAEVINGIVMAQSSYGTTHIGRFDLEVDTDNGGLLDWKWQRVPLTEETSEFDYGVDDLADRIVFREKKKHSTTTLCEFADEYTQLNRLYESDLGDIIADAFAQMYPVEFVIMQSGSLRRERCGPKFTEKDLKELYPFDDYFYAVQISGKELKECFDYLFSIKDDGTVMNGTFQYSKGFRLEVDGTDCWEKGCKVTSISLFGKELEDDRMYTVGMTKNCTDNCFTYFSKVFDESRCNIVSLSTFYDLARWFLTHEGKVEAPPKGRFIFNNFDPSTIKK